MGRRIGVRVMGLLAAGGLLLHSGFGQGRGGSGSAPATGSTGSSGSVGTGSVGTGAKSPTGTPSNTTNPSTTTQPTNIPPPIFISGRVLLEDGTPPSESVTIERVCSGSPHAEGYTDSKGYFGIQLGQSNAVLQDASEVGSSGGGGVFGVSNTSGLGQRSTLGGGAPGGASSDMRYMNCDLQARLAGFRSQLVSLANHRAMDNPDIGIILLHRLSPTEGTTVSASSLAAPKDAHKAFDKGMEAARKQKWDDAAKGFQKAVDLYPEYAEAWYELGRLQMSAAPDTARISFACAMKADPKFAAPYADLAAINIKEKKWKDVVSVTDRGIRLDSFDYPELFFYNAVGNYYLRNTDVAEKNARQAIKLDTQHRFPQSSYVLGLILVMRQDYAAAVEPIQTYLKLSPDAEDAPAAKQTLERIAKVTAQASASEPKQDQ